MPATSWLVESACWRLVGRAVSLKFTGRSESGELAAREMIRGGGAGLRYLPKANAEIAMIEMIAAGLTKLANPSRPSRRAQSSHHAALAQRWIRARQPLLASRSPHSAQKLGRYIVGGSAAKWHGRPARGFTRKMRVPPSNYNHHLSRLIIFDWRRAPHALNILQRMVLTEC